MGYPKLLLLKEIRKQYDQIRCLVLICLKQEREKGNDDNARSWIKNIVKSQRGLSSVIGFTKSDLLIRELSIVIQDLKTENEKIGMSVTNNDSICQNSNRPLKIVSNS